MVSSHFHGLHKTISVLFIFIFSLGVPCTTQATRELYPLEWECNFNKDTYTSNSTFSLNLEVAFSNLTALSSSRHFSNVTIGSDDDEANKVYALYDCRNDISLNKCQRCIKDAINTTLDYCNQPKEAVFIYEECTLRYANHMIFSTMELTPNYTFCSLFYYISYGFGSDVKSNLKSLIDEATMESSPTNYFATKHVTYTTLIGDYIFLVQCTPYLSRKQCKECLTDAFNLAVEPCASDDRTRGQFNGPSCQMRYEYDTFLNVSSSSSDLVPSSSSSPSPSTSHSHSPSPLSLDEDIILSDQTVLVPSPNEAMESSSQPPLVPIPNISFYLSIILLSLFYVID